MAAQCAYDGGWSGGADGGSGRRSTHGAELRVLVEPIPRGSGDGRNDSSSKWVVCWVDGRVEQLVAGLLPEAKAGAAPAAAPVAVPAAAGGEGGL